MKVVNYALFGMARTKFKRVVRLQVPIKLKSDGYKFASTLKTTYDDKILSILNSKDECGIYNLKSTPKGELVYTDSANSRRELTPGDYIITAVVGRIYEGKTKSEYLVVYVANMTKTSLINMTDLREEVKAIKDSDFAKLVRGSSGKKVKLIKLNYSVREMHGHDVVCALNGEFMQIPCEVNARMQKKPQPQVNKVAGGIKPMDGSQAAKLVRQKEAAEWRRQQSINKATEYYTKWAKKQLNRREITAYSLAACGNSKKKFIKYAEVICDRMEIRGLLPHGLINLVGEFEMSRVAFVKMLYICNELIDNKAKCKILYDEPFYTFLCGNGSNEITRAAYEQFIKPLNLSKKSKNEKKIDRAEVYVGMNHQDTLRQLGYRFAERGRYVDRINGVRTINNRELDYKLQMLLSDRTYNKLFNSTYGLDTFNSGLELLTFFEASDIFDALSYSEYGVDKKLCAIAVALACLSALYFGEVSDMVLNELGVKHRSFACDIETDKRPLDNRQRKALDTYFATNFRVVNVDGKYYDVTKLPSEMKRSIKSPCKLPYWRSYVDHRAARIPVTQSIKGIENCFPRMQARAGVFTFEKDGTRLKIHNNVTKETQVVLFKDFLAMGSAYLFLM